MDVVKQMEVDPSGMLALFWQEQRKMLGKSVQTRWNPDVSIHLIIF